MDNIVDDAEDMCANQQEPHFGSQWVPPSKRQESTQSINKYAEPDSPTIGPKRARSRDQSPGGRLDRSRTVENHRLGIDMAMETELSGPVI